MLRAGHYSPPQHLPSIVIEPPRPTLSQPVRRNSGPKRAVAACPICPDPDPDCPCQNPGSSSSPPSLSHTHLHSHTPGTGHMERCGFCQSSNECLCVDEPEDVKPIIDPDCGVCNALGGCICDEPPQQPVASQIQPILTNTLGESAMLSAGVDSNGAMRLRLKTRTGPKTTLWAIEPVGKKEAVCSGDPSNCEACRDDSFGTSKSSSQRLKLTARPRVLLSLVFVVLLIEHLHSLFHLPRQLHVHRIATLRHAIKRGSSDYDYHPLPSSACENPEDCHASAYHR